MLKSQILNRILGFGATPHRKKTGSQEGKTGQGNQEKQQHPERRTAGYHSAAVVPDSCPKFSFFGTKKFVHNNFIFRTRLSSTCQHPSKYRRALKHARTRTPTHRPTLHTRTNAHSHHKSRYHANTVHTLTLQVAGRKGEEVGGRGWEEAKEKEARASKCQRYKKERNM